MRDNITLLNDTISNLNSTTVKLSSSNTTSDSIAFGIDSDSNYGYIIPGADTVTPFKSEITFGLVLGISQTDAVGASVGSSIVYTSVKAGTSISLTGSVNTFPVNVYINSTVTTIAYNVTKTVTVSESDAGTSGAILKLSWNAYLNKSSLQRNGSITFKV